MSPTLGALSEVSRPSRRQSIGATSSTRTCPGQPPLDRRIHLRARAQADERVVMPAVDGETVRPAEDHQRLIFRADVLIEVLLRERGRELVGRPPGDEDGYPDVVQAPGVIELLAGVVQLSLP